MFRYLQRKLHAYYLFKLLLKCFAVGSFLLRKVAGVLPTGHIFPQNFETHFLSGQKSLLSLSPEGA
jgi:hypothetical protein